MGIIDVFYFPLKCWEKENQSRSAATKKVDIKLEQYDVNPKALHGSI